MGGASGPYQGLLGMCAVPHVASDGLEQAQAGKGGGSQSFFFFWICANYYSYLADPNSGTPVSHTPGVRAAAPDVLPGEIAALLHH